MTTGSPARPGHLDKEALRRKYAEERDKRLRPDGNDQYLRLSGEFAHYLDDPYTPWTERGALTDHRTVVCVGGGFAGLVTAARLREAGVDVRILEKGGDFGGTWYWNRYPGAQCDTASMVYMPLLEETGHMPTEKYVHGPEILAHCQRIGRKFGLYDDVLFHTEVTGLTWDGSRWIIETSRGDRLTAQFVVLGTGPLSVPKLPGIPGIGSFRGHSFHTSRWDYDYTGGDVRDQGCTPMRKLAGQSVGLIGTGATAIQCVPHLSRASRELYVFQRTPSSVDVRNNHPIDPDWFAEVAEPGWQRRWLENFTANQAGGTADEDLVQDGWTDIARRIRARIALLPPEDLSPAAMLAAYEESDFKKMEEIRARADAVVRDPDTARNLKAWYRQLCKRPCFHDEYLQAFNNPNTHLVDTDGKGVERITAAGVVAAGREYKLDCLIYGSGFEVGTPYARRAGFEVTGRRGTLSEYWADGMRTLHGIHVRGFPNLLFVQPTQGANLISNVPHNIVDSARTITVIIRHALDGGFCIVEPSRDAEDAWVTLLLSGPGSMIGGPDCTPGYYNNEGQDSGAFLGRGYPYGPSAYFAYIDKWRASGTFDGLEFR